MLRLPMVYGPHDGQAREDIVLRRLRAGRRRMPVGAGNLLWSRAHVDDVATAVLAALATRRADGQALNLGEATTPTIRAWVEQIIASAGADLQLIRVRDELLPPDLVLLGAPAQHLLAATQRAEELLGWNPGSPHDRVEASVRWHLQHPAGPEWTEHDTAADETALAAP